MVNTMGSKVKTSKIAYVLICLCFLIGCKRLHFIEQWHREKKIATAESEDVICKIGDITLTKEEFQQLWEAFIEKNRLNDKTVQAIARPQFLEQLIEQFLIIAYAREKGMDNDPRYIRLREMAERQVLIDFTLNKTLYSTITVSEDELTTYYYHHIKEYTIPARVQVRHILTRTREEAENALKRIQAGEDFESVAREVSIHSSKINGGILPPFSRGTYDKDFEEMAFRLKVGEVSPIVKSSLGYHIIEKTGESPEQIIPLSEVKDKIRDDIIRQKKKKLYEEFIKQLRSEFPVVM